METSHWLSLKFTALKVIPDANGSEYDADLLYTDVYLKRLKAWDTIKVRKFTIERVYTSDQGQDDVLILGHLGTVLSDGRKGDEHWTARIVSAIDTDGTRKISLYRIWTVSKRL